MNSITTAEQCEKEFHKIFKNAPPPEPKPLSLEQFLTEVDEILIPK